MMNLAELQKKEAHLKKIGEELKQELFGIDHIIDRVIDLTRVWYLMPSLLARPVIINLWGMTGVGKTQLVRRLAQKLNFNEKFVEIQMDGIGASSSSNRSGNSILSILQNSSIQEKEPGIILLDEMQRFRTVGNEGEDIKLDRYQDVWMLLSDGKFSLDSSIFFEFEMMLAQREWARDRKDNDEDEDEDDEETKTKKPKNTKFFIYPYEAKNIKTMLKLPESIQEIMTWTPERIQKCIEDFIKTTQTMETDYTKMLIFVSGNLDDLFSPANSVNDADTDADTYYQITKKLTPTDVKKALKNRFKPEQIARFGSNNIIYPSLNRSTYERIIKTTCERYITQVQDLTGEQIKFTLTENLYEEIYRNAVYPAQGTRPVFSAIHQIFGSGLSELALWGMESNLDQIEIDLNADKQVLIGTSGKVTKIIPTLLELHQIRKRMSKDFSTTVAVHEAGHALVYAHLFKLAPLETKINLASYSGGYVTPHEFEMTTKQNLLDLACLGLAGTVAEEMVFGEINRGVGHASDMVKVTQYISGYVRKYGFDEIVSTMHPEAASIDYQFNTDIRGTNDIVERIIKELKKSCRDLLDLWRDQLIILVDELLEHSSITPERFRELIPEISYSTNEAVVFGFSKVWEDYKRDQKRLIYANPMDVGGNI